MFQRRLQILILTAAVLNLSACVKASKLPEKTTALSRVTPYVKSVTSSTSDAATKTTGNVISIEVKFSQTVFVDGGTPTLTLETGATDAVVNYVSGSGSDTLVFTYTVAVGENSSDLQYESTTALSANGATIRNSNDKDSTLILPALASASSLAGSKALVVDTAQPTIVSVSSTTAAGNYNVGDVISIQVVFSEIVNVVGGTPTLTLETGAADAVVNYVSGTGSTTLNFNYTVAVGHTSADLEYVSTASFANGGATIRDGVLLNAVTTLPAIGGGNSLSDLEALVIDGIAPTVASVTSSTANGTYNIGDVVSVQVVFSEIVNVAVGTPTLTLETGTTDAVVNWDTTGSGTTTLNFQYTVASGENSLDLQYISTAALLLGGATIQDVAGNNATLTLPALGSALSLGGSKAIIIDGVGPTITNVSSTTAAGTYKLGDTVSIQVTFSEAVVVAGGTPTLTLETGVTDGVASWAGTGSGTNTLDFTYTVGAGEESLDLQYNTPATALALAGATIEDTNTNPATLTLPGVASGFSLAENEGLIIDGIAPTITSVNSSTIDGTYIPTQTVSIQVVFSEIVNVTVGTPTLTLETGATDAVVSWAGTGSGTTTLNFTYTVGVGETSPDLQYQSTAALALAGALIRDAAGNNATLTLPGMASGNSLAENKALVIAGGAPTIVSVSSTTPAATYKIGDTISIQVVFSEIVNVAGGIPVLTLETGTTDGTATWNGTGSGTTTLNFDYVVGAGEESLDLQYNTPATALANGGATIQNGVLVNADLSLPATNSGNSLAELEAIIIDGVRPTVTSVTSSTLAGTYGPTDTVSIQVTFSEAVTVAGGTPTLTLETGATDAIVNWAGTGSGTTILNFTYTVANGESSLDLQYESLAALALGGATIRDAIGNDATLTLPGMASGNSLAEQEAIVIDGNGPTVTSVSSTTAAGTYKIGDTISIQVTFSEAVTVAGGNPQLTLETGAADAVLTWNGTGSGTTVLNFDYTIVAGENSLDLQYHTPATAFVFNGSTIEDVSGNSAVLTLPATNSGNSLAELEALIVDGVVPTVSTVSSTTAAGTYVAGQTISIQVTFNEAVNVAGGTPQLTLETGATDAVVNWANSGSGTTTLDFTYTIAADEISADLQYESLAALALNGATITDLAGNPATLTLPGMASGNSLAELEALVIDAVVPRVVSVSSATGDATFNTGGVISIQVTFDQIVNVAGGTPTLTLETGTADAVVNWNTTGSGTTTLNFTYTVGTNQNSADLQYVGTGSLALGGATIRDVNNNNAILTLPGLASGNSLGENHNLVIDTVAALSWEPGGANPADPFDYGSNLSANTASTTFTLRNIGNGSTSGTITTSFTGANAANFEITADTCNGNTLADNATCTVQARFNAGTATAGAKTANLRATTGSVPTGGTADNGLQGSVTCPSAQVASYNVATAGTTYTVPGGCTSVFASVWGGGGGGKTTTSGGSGNGGGGGYVTGELFVSPGDVLTVKVGGGGRSTPGAGSAGGTNGGGSSQGGAGSGGGYSQVLNAGAVNLITAGGGGGAMHTYDGGAGGTMGGDPVGDGQSGTPGAEGLSGANGGTRGTNGFNDGNNGGAYSGGAGGAANGPAEDGGGGGGGGCVGGGGGAGGSDANTMFQASGGGGSSCWNLTTTIVDNITDQAGAAMGAPGGQGDANYSAPAGEGANAGTSGSDGRVVFVTPP